MAACERGALKAHRCRRRHRGPRRVRPPRLLLLRRRLRHGLRRRLLVRRHPPSAGQVVRRRIGQLLELGLRPRRRRQRRRRRGLERRLAGRLRRVDVHARHINGLVLVLLEPLLKRRRGHLLRRWRDVLRWRRGLRGRHADPVPLLPRPEKPVGRANQQRRGGRMFRSSVRDRPHCSESGSTGELTSPLASSPQPLQCRPRSGPAECGQRECLGHHAEQSGTRELDFVLQNSVTPRGFVSSRQRRSRAAAARPAAARGWRQSPGPVLRRAEVETMSREATVRMSGRA